MAKLPTIEDFGDRPSSRSPRTVVSFEADQVPNAEAKGSRQMAQSLGAASEQIAEIFERQQNRDDALARAKARTRFFDESAAELRRLQTEADFSEPEVLQKFRERQAIAADGILANHKGSADSKARLAITLRGMQSQFLNQGALFASDASLAQMTSALNTGINGLTSVTYDNPSAVGQSFEALDVLIDDMAPGLTPSDELKFQAHGRERIAASAVESFLDRGLFPEAQEIMRGTPGLVDVMSPELQNRLKGRIAQFQRAQFEAETAGRRKVETAEQILGRRATPAERAKLAGVAPPVGQQTVSDKIQEIEDAIGRPLNERERANAAGLETPQAVSPEGKVVQDRQMFISQFGEGSEQVAAFDALSRDPGGPPSLSDIGGQRKEFTKASGVFVSVRDSFNRVVASVQDPSAAGDLSLIFNYMKILDPGSVVRESEFAQAAAAGSWGQRLQAAADRFIAGKRLSDDMRADFAERAELLMQVQLGTHLQLEAQFRDLAQRAGINPDDVVIDYIGELRAMFPGAAPASTGQDAPQRAVPRLQFDLNGNRIGG